MADTTPVLGLPFPELAVDDPNVPEDIQALAEKVEDVLTPAGLAAGKGLIWNGSAWTAEDIATQAELAAAIVVPSGSIFDFAGSAAPGGFLLCDGAAVSRATYAALFAAIGTGYGIGDGSSTFNLPDLRGRVAVGKGSHGDVDALGDSDGLAVGSRRPAHAHSISADGSHSHTVSSHSHTVNSHSHTVNGHTHQHISPIATQSLDHGFLPSGNSALDIVGNYSLYDSGVANTVWYKGTTDSGPIERWVVTSSSSAPGTSSSSPGTSSSAPGTNSQGSHSHGGASGAEAPAFVVVNKIIKT